MSNSTLNLNVVAHYTCFAYTIVWRHRCLLLTDITINIPEQIVTGIKIAVNNKHVAICCMERTNAVVTNKMYLINPFPLSYKDVRSAVPRFEDNIVPGKDNIEDNLKIILCLCQVGEVVL